jgi:hypothetical protein
MLFWVCLFAFFECFTQIMPAFVIQHTGKRAAAGLPAET